MSRLIERGLPCDKCGSSDAKAEYDTNWYCFSCHHSIPKKLTKQAHRAIVSTEETISTCQLPDDFTTVLPNLYLAHLYSYRFTDYLIHKYHIGHSETGNMWSERLQQYYTTGPRLILPYYEENKLQFYEGKYIGSKQRTKYITVGGKKILFKTFYQPQEMVVIVEDILSAMRIGEVASCVALRGTHFTNEQLLAIMKLGSKFIVWLDSDAPGIRAATKLKTKLDWMGAPSWVVTEATQDPKCYNDDTIRSILQCPT